jgi:hypothetical protein
MMKEHINNDPLHLKYPRRSGQVQRMNQNDVQKKPSLSAAE